MIFWMNTWRARWLWPAVLALLVGCDLHAPNPGRLIRENNFEGTPPAGTPDGLYSQEQAHSWTQSLKVGQPVEYGTLAAGTWEALGRPHHLRLRLWTRLPPVPLNRATLEVLVRRPGAGPNHSAQPLASHSFNLCDVVRRYQQWVPNTFFVSLPRSLQPTDEVTVFVWVRPGIDTPIYVDDFSLENLD